MSDQSINIAFYNYYLSIHGHYPNAHFDSYKRLASHASLESSCCLKEHKGINPTWRKSEAHFIRMGKWH